MTRFYIEIRKPLGPGKVSEHYDYTCETQEQANQYAKEKAQLHSGYVSVCRPAKDQRGTR